MEIDADEKVKHLIFSETQEGVIRGRALWLSEKDINDISDRLCTQKESSKSTKCVTGTGWVVNENHIVTCYHIVKGKEKIICIKDGMLTNELEVAVLDEENDLAVLRMRSDEVFDDSLPLRRMACNLAEKVFTIGYPLSSILGQDQKYSERCINSMSGIDHDSRYYQISVPIQPGNSGGPLVDLKGNVIGITSSALNAIATAVVTGAIPQNVNYAIKVRYLVAMLEDNQIPFRELAGYDEPVKKVQQAVVLIMAY